MLSKLSLAFIPICLCLAQTVEDLGSPIQTVTQSKTILWQFAGKKHASFWYDRTDLAVNQQVFDVNLTDGTTRVVDVGYAGRANQRDKLIGSDGNLYFGTNSPCDFVQVNMTTGAVTRKAAAGWPLHGCGPTTADNASTNGATPAEGDASKLFFGVYPHANVFRYDVTTDTVTDFGPISAPGGNPTCIGCVRDIIAMKADADYAYVAITDYNAGDTWLTILKLSDSTQVDCFKGLATPNTVAFRRTSDGAPILDRFTGGVHYWYLLSGAAGCPVSTLSPDPTVDGYYNNSGNSCFYTDDVTCATIHGVNIDVTNIEANTATSGVATLAYRLTPGSGAWTSKTGTLTLYPATIGRLVQDVANNMFLATGAYGPIGTQTLSPLSSTFPGYIHQSTYSAAKTGNYWVVGGYDSRYHVWDATAAWTCGGGECEACFGGSPTNPCISSVTTAEYNYFAGTGNDDRVYFGGRNNASSPAGASVIAWVRPSDLTHGEYATGMTCYRPKSFIAAAGGSLMVLSGQGIGGSGACIGETEMKLFVFDVATQTIVQTWTPHSGATLGGTIAELANGNIVWISEQHPTATQYTAVSINPVTGTVAWTVTGTYTTSIFNAGSLEGRRLPIGPEGYPWFYVDGNLSIMSPVDGSVTAILATAVGSRSGQLTTAVDGAGQRAIYMMGLSTEKRIALWRPASFSVRNSQATATQIRLKYGRTTTLDATAVTQACAFNATCVVSIPGHVIGDGYYQWQLLTAADAVVGASDVTKVTLP